ncbi:MAG: ABC transporter permease [Asgard group archaeon]|nr:ABC transporter permease [Asgard group archaeon]
MMESYENLTRYEKNISWKRRFGVIYQLYLRKLLINLFKKKISWIFNSLIILPIIVGPIIALLTKSFDLENFFGLYSDIMFLGYIGIIIPLFTLYVATILTQDEINDKTIGYLTTRPIHKIELVVTKYLSFLTVMPLFTAIGGLLFYLPFAIFGGFVYFKAALMFLLGTIVSTIVYGAFYLYVSVLFNNPLWFGLFFSLIWEFVIVSFSATINNLTIAYYIKSLLVKGNPSPIIFGQNQAYVFNSMFSGGASYLNIILVLSILVIVFLTLTWFKLQAYKFKLAYLFRKPHGDWKHYLKEIRRILITFGIIITSIGLVIGPSKGLKEINDYTKDVQINISNRYFYGDENFRPTKEDMGYGDYFTYPLKNGDSLIINFEPINILMYNTSYWGLLLTRNEVDLFFTKTQNLWLDYYEQIFYDIENRDIYLAVLLSNYFFEVNSLAENALAKIKMTSTTIDAKINYTATVFDDYFIAYFLGWYDYSSRLYFSDNYTIPLAIVSSRMVLFTVGFVLFSIGLISFGFVISLFALKPKKFENKQSDEQKEITISITKEKAEYQTEQNK